MYIEYHYYKYPILRCYQKETSKRLKNLIFDLFLNIAENSSDRNVIYL